MFKEMQSAILMKCRFQSADKHFYDNEVEGGASADILIYSESFYNNSNIQPGESI